MVSPQLPNPQQLNSARSRTIRYAAEGTDKVIGLKKEMHRAELDCARLLSLFSFPTAPVPFFLGKLFLNAPIEALRQLKLLLFLPETILPPQPPYRNKALIHPRGE